MKSSVLCALLVFLGLDTFSRGVVLEAGNVDVVIDRKALPVVRFAADEATNFLSRVFGAPVPVVNAPRSGRAALVLGVNEWSRTAGIDPDAKPVDTYFIKTAPGRVYLAGRDGRYDPVPHPAAETSAGQERATLFAVYAFLEKFAGCRFYFPGEMGEVVPRASRLSVPDADVAVTPDCLVRRVYNPNAAWYDNGPYEQTGPRIDWLRKRLGTVVVDCCHGTARWKFKERYAESHPEYFALMKDGIRYTGDLPGQRRKKGHLCFSNPGLRQAVFEECVQRFAKGEKYVDIMPNDGLPECQCEGCQKMYRHDDNLNFASELIWDHTVDIANRLRKAGIDGKITQMAYWPYRRIPDIEIPDNVEVMVAEFGPYSTANRDAVRREHDEIRAWAKKIGRRVWIWTYPHKYHETEIPDIPDFTPRSIGEYYGAVGDVIFGTFMQSETDRRIFHYLGDYVLSRLLWDKDTDVKAVIAEHHRLMFGGGAGEMAEFFSVLERKWICDICGDTKETNIGPVTIPPSRGDLWTKTYSPAVMSRLDRLLKTAAAKTSVGSIERRRTEFMRKQFFDPLAALPAAWHEQMAKVKALMWTIADGSEIALRPLAKDGAGLTDKDIVKTTVAARRTDGALEFRFDCEEPRMEEIVAYRRRKHDDKDTWRDSGVVRRGDGFAVTVSIPLSSLGADMKDAFPAEFCRNRVLRGGAAVSSYIWGACSRMYKDTENYVTVVTR